MKIDPNCAEIEIRVTPRASRSRVSPTPAAPVTVHVTAPPADGRANAAALDTIAAFLKVAPSCVTLVAGRRSRLKRIRVEGFTQAELEALLLVSSPPC